MQVRSLVAITFGSLLAAVWLGAALAAEKLPKFPKDAEYSEARRSLLALDWAPVKLPDADTCQDGDDRCKGRPEMLACAGTGQANCVFTWKRGDTLIEVMTIGEMPIVSGVRCRAGC